MKANDEHGHFNGPGEVRIVRTLPGPIERVWEYLTDPEKRGRWFAGGPMEPRQGGKLTLNFRHINIAPDETPPEDHKQFHDPGESMNGIVTRWEPPRVLAYTFGDTGESEVTFELATRDKSVLLVLTHRARGGDLPYIAGFAAGWHAHLAHLIALLEGAPRPAFWPIHGRLRAEYVQLLAAGNSS
jgi:uncharacterized protein YndB with AHSA1/START domain